jgi:regulator of protease activity HflC (stomatin/prohibitin superfamily)
MLNFRIPTQFAKLARRGAWTVLVLYFLFFVIGFPLVNVTQGSTGIDMFFGKAIATRASGWTFKLPFIDVIEINNKAVPTAIQSTESPTHDLQQAQIDINSSWSILPGGSLNLYNYFGDEKAVEQALIVPGLMEVQKALSAKYDAYDLQQKAPAIAEEAKTNMNVWLTESLKMHNLPNQIDVATVLFPHVEFSKEFKAATTEQTKTEQSVGTFENQRTKAFTDAEAAKAAKVREAQAQSYEIHKNADAETAGIVAKAKALRENPRMLCYLVHQGWDGKLPEVSNGSSPLPFSEVCNK